ncbi:hypothetical protein DQ04_01211010 [Trypanosoma grayi]|uniref:hypothetical protein n=1 Tax=Trypanosoma grayi TaxID=71804 RepID=UPI0004F46D2F|nr:hypothetical protein DQ04_01211010 [Trypanosoma grayi]KEG13102.1 hypothetical protein DQ04_01211010 [Trypanosoma grayi]
MRAAPFSRRRVLVSKAVQTEASFPPDCTNVEEHYKGLASEQFDDLCKLRDVIRDAMKEVACSVYDVVAFKDILFKIEDELPSSLPVTDMLLLSSKLFRRAAELGRLLGCFFTVVFAEEHVDEDFHFTELRVLRRELLDLKKQFAKADEERARLQRMLDDVGRVAVNHSRAVDLLETRNAALQLQTSGLEDQMALLFSQLNKDLHRQCKEGYEKVTNEIDSQDRMNLTKATFRQTMDSLSDQLRHSRTLINDVRELVLSCAQGGTGGGRNVDAQISKEPSIRFKLKQVENNFQQLVGRFSAVKGIVAETAQELMNALHERKNILYLSLQHIRLYDIQNTKMRQSKAIVVEMKRGVEELLKRIGVTFPSGAVTFVDRIGRISTQQWQVGQTLATIRNQKASELSGDETTVVSASQVPSPLPPAPMAPAPPSQKRVSESDIGGEERQGASVPDVSARMGTGSYNVPFQTVYNIVDLVKLMERSMENLVNTLNFENEINAFLKTLTLSLSTTPREVDETFGDFSDADAVVDKALLPTGDASYKRSNAVDTPTRKAVRNLDRTASHSILSFSGQGERRQSIESEKAASVVAEQERRLQELQEQLDNVRPEFAVKIGFLRQVYEARICDLEMKEANIQRRVGATTPQKEAKETKEPPKKRQGRGEREMPASRASDNSDAERRRKKDDRDHLLLSRSEWHQTKPALQGNKKVREAMMNELTKMMRDPDPSEKQERRQSMRSKGTGRSVTTSISR